MRSKGFTLLETLVAFTLLSVFTMLMVNLLVENRSRAEKINHMLQLVAVSENAIDKIRMDISSGDIRANYSEKEGEISWLATVHASNNSRVGASLYKIQLSVMDESGKKRITLDSSFLPLQ